MRSSRAAWLVVLVCGCSFKGGTLPASADDADVDQATIDDAALDGAVDMMIDGPPPSSPRKLVFDNSASTADFMNFQVLVALNPSNVDYAMVSDPTTDLRFEDEASANDIPFDVETWIPGGESIIWVRVPLIPLGSTTTAVLLHFGPTANGQADTNATWNGFNLVHHFSGTANAVDSNYAATFVNATMAAGSAGNAATFSAADHRVTFASSSGLLDGWQDFTISFWLYLDYNSAALTSEPDVMEKSGGPIRLGRILHPGDAELRFQLDMQFNGMNNTAYMSANVPPKTWTHLMYMSNGNLARVIRNGVVGQTFNITGGTQSLISGSQSFYLGSTVNDAFRGQLDELRIEQRPRTPDYAVAQYKMMTRQFVTFVDP